MGIICALGLNFFFFFLCGKNKSVLGFGFISFLFVKLVSMLEFFNFFWERG